MHSFCACVSVILCLFSLLSPAECSSAFPPEVPRCKVGDTDCITRTTVSLVRQYAKTGLPSAGFPVIEPFLVKRVDISDGRETALSLKLIFKDLLVSGLSEVNLERSVGFEKNPLKSKFEMYGSFPAIKLHGKYSADGRILILPINGDGDADITLVNPKFSFKFKPAAQTTNGKTYISVDKLKVLVEPKKMNIKLTNLFNGDQRLGAHLNEFLNENWSDVWTELQPSIHLAIAEIAKSVIENISTKFSYEDLFLEE